MTNNIVIKSGIDINSEPFKKYYEFLKSENIECYYLNFAISDNSKVLSNPFKFEEQEYRDYYIDDISFIIIDNEIAGHMVYSLQKQVPTVPLGINSGNYLDMNRVKKITSRISNSRLEYFCKYNININNFIIEYLSSRIHGKLEYEGIMTSENKIRIKK